ncbi:MAG: ornithine cyclodeaminase family protein [Desulfurococcales archaeon]|nr:ornithine cyclodeaminase family protein [Desulfurococcales archaeon]
MGGLEREFEMVVKVTGDSIDELVDPEVLINDIKSVLLNAPEPPLRSSVTYKGSWFGVMPSVGMGFFSVKIVGVYPGNPAKGLPLVRGLLLLFKSDDGELLLEADAGPATGWRTAAASMLALELLGYRGGGEIGVIGAGVQARYHIDFMLKIYDISSLMIHSRTPSKARVLAREYGAEVVGLEKLLKRSDVVIAATNSTTPVVKGELLKSGAMVVSVGAPKPVRELDDRTISRSRCVLVDTRRGAVEETDDIEGAQAIVELSEALRGVECDYGDIRVYKSVGYALFDLAIAMHLYRNAMQKSQVS